MTSNIQPELMQTWLTLVAILIALATTVTHVVHQTRLHKEQLKVQLFEKRYVAVMEVRKLIWILSQPIDTHTLISRHGYRHQLNSLAENDYLTSSSLRDSFCLLFGDHTRDHLEKLFEATRALSTITLDYLNALDSAPLADIKDIHCKRMHYITHTARLANILSDSIADDLYIAERARLSTHSFIHRNIAKLSNWVDQAQAEAENTTKSRMR